MSNRYFIFVTATAMLASGCSRPPPQPPAGNPATPAANLSSDVEPDDVDKSATNRWVITTIPGFSAGSLYATFKTGFTQTTFPGDGARFWECSKDQGNCTLKVSAYGNEISRIQTVSASVHHPGGMPSQDEMSTFLGDVAALQYQGADPSMARSWVKANIDKPNTERRIGGMHFRLSTNEEVHFLIFHPSAK